MDLVLRLVLPNGRNSLLNATFARHLRVAFEFQERRGGYPLSLDAKYTPLPDGGWHVFIDFAHTGTLEFDCSELHLE